MRGLHHIAVICSDKAGALEFYRDKLGFPVIRENYRPERDDWKIDLQLDDSTELELSIMKGHLERPSPEAYGPGFVTWRSAWRAWMIRYGSLKAKGYRVSQSEGTPSQERK